LCSGQIKKYHRHAALNASFAFVSPGDPDLQRQIEFHTRPVFMRPEFALAVRARASRTFFIGYWYKSRFRSSVDPSKRTARLLPMSYLTARFVVAQRSLIT